MFEQADSKNLPEPAQDASGHLLQSAFDSPVKTANQPGSSESLLSEMSSSKLLTDLKDRNSEPFKMPEWAPEAGAAVLLIGTMLLTRSAVKNAGLSTRLGRIGGTAVEEMSLKSGLALDLASTNLSGVETNSLAFLIKRPLPSFAKIEGKVASELPMSAAALKQSQSYVETGLISSRIENGLRLPVIIDSKGFTAAGLARDSSEKFIVVNKADDPILQAAINDAKERYAGRALTPELAEDLRGYVSGLMNRHNLPGSNLEQLYEEMLRRNSSKLIPVGLFLERGSGACLPRSAVYKTIADEIGMQARLREGLLGIKKPQPHVWTDVKFGSGIQVYDASHAANPAFRYLSSKH